MDISFVNGGVVFADRRNFRAVKVDYDKIRAIFTCPRQGLVIEFHTGEPISFSEAKIGNVNDRWERVMRDMMTQCTMKK